jgi:hypothetical protein
VPYTNDKYDNIIVFYGAYDTVSADPIFPETLKVLAKWISKTTRVLVGRYFIFEITE